MKLKCYDAGKFICEHCDYKASQKGTLLRHIKSRHEGVKYPCGQCGYKASTKSNLLQHIKSIHEGVKFPCEHCDYKATERGTLKKHMKSAHEGVKFPCKQCTTGRHGWIGDLRSYCWDSGMLYIKIAGRLPSFYT